MKKKNTQKNRQKLRNAPIMQLSKQLNLYDKQTSAIVNITYPGYIYAYSTSGKYTFTNNSDVRYLAFASVQSAVEFTNFATVYNNYKIRSASVIINPLSVNTSLSSGKYPLPLLLFGADPQDPNTSSNPTNSTFIIRDNNHIFSPSSNVVKSVTFTFPGTGVGTNIWKDTDSLSDRGLFYIGNNDALNFFSDNFPVFEYYINLLIEFRGAK